jgi:mannose-6-phosphate isomerase-like protein (cupin superfamily)
MRRIEKPWGYEEILEENKHYVIKRIFVKKGHRISKQYHKIKTETWIYPDGKIENIPPGKIHRLEAKKKDIEIIEISTPELDDIIRLEDDYGRV